VPAGEIDARIELVLPQAPARVRRDQISSPTDDKADRQPWETPVLREIGLDDGTEGKLNPVGFETHIGTSSNVGPVS
jgi:hypothetical protein